MKFSFTAAIASLVLASTPVLSQRVIIASPASGSTVTAGSNINIEIDRPSFQSSSIEVALVIAINSCSNGFCFPPSQVLGPVLYNGPFNPQLDPNPQKLPNQNFTVTVPTFLGTGLHQLNVFHIALLGASDEPFTDFQNITLNIQD